MLTALTSLKKSLQGAGHSRSERPERSAPHPVPAGREQALCPITGLGLGTLATLAAKAEMDADADIVQERTAAKPVQLSLQPLPADFLRLNVPRRSHQATGETRRLVQELGGVPALQAFTECFYEKCFRDPHIDRFIANHEEPHGLRFALWIAEKLGDGAPWTEERRSRPLRTMRLGGETHQVAFDRSSAHFAAWHSPKREPEKWGQHFQLEDARIWMRLHFWAAREQGVFEHPQFADYYVRFIGHFVSVYSSKSPPFTREAARWSADPRNIQRYLDNGRRMLDFSRSYEEALLELPVQERRYSGSGHSQPSWPYEEPSLEAWLSCSCLPER